MSWPWVRVALIVAAIVAVVAVAFVALRGGGTSPEALRAGDCIDVPSTTELSAIPKRPCTEPHAGEVFHVFEVANAAGGTAYPSDPEWGQLIYPICDPAFEDYTGTPVETRTDIDYVYLVPTEDRWASGDRRVTCVIQSLDGAPLLRSYREAT
jgi:Septum formation